MTVWLQTKVRERGLGLQPRLYLTLADAAALCGLWRYKSAMHLCFCLWIAFTSGPRPGLGHPLGPVIMTKKYNLTTCFFCLWSRSFAVVQCWDAAIIESRRGGKTGF